MDAAPCEHCQQLEREITNLRRRLTHAGVELDEPGDLADNDRERELARWLDGHREATAAAGYRAGWARFARYAAPRLREWEQLWWKAAREGDRLRARVGLLIQELSRLSDRG